MPYVSSIEQISIEQEWKAGWIEGWNRGWKEGWEKCLRDELLPDIELALEAKFGARGKRLLPRIRRVKSVATLKAVRLAVTKISDLSVLRQLLS